MHIIDEAFEKAKETLRMNMTDRGFTACSRSHDSTPDSNYNSVWTRDASICLLWVLPMRDAELTQCGRRSLETVFSKQSVDGHLPNYVWVDSGKAEFGGIGNIGGIDGPMWAVRAATKYCEATGDVDFARKHFNCVHKVIKWLRSHDSNNCGLLEIPESSDWCDLFPRSYNVLYDEVLWYRVNMDFAQLRDRIGDRAPRYAQRAEKIRKLINERFWPTPEIVRRTLDSQYSMQLSLGRTRYLITQITPFGFNWRCDVYANILAYLFDVLDDDRAERVWHFLCQISVDEPAPVKVLYPAINPGAADWRDYFLVNLLNLPHHYHNGGIWPLVGGLWVRFLEKLGNHQNAGEALEKLAKLCRLGVYQEWEFNEWAHGLTGKPMGKAHQCWSAASYVAAYLAHQGDKTLG